MGRLQQANSRYMYMYMLMFRYFLLLLYLSQERRLHCIPFIQTDKKLKQCDWKELRHGCGKQ